MKDKKKGWHIERKDLCTIRWSGEGKAPEGELLEELMEHAEGRINEMKGDYSSGELICETEVRGRLKSFYGYWGYYKDKPEHTGMKCYIALFPKLIFTQQEVNAALPGRWECVEDTQELKERFPVEKKAEIDIMCIDVFTSNLNNGMYADMSRFWCNEFYCER